MQRTINQEFLTSNKNLKLKHFLKQTLKISFLSVSCLFSLYELFLKVNISYGLIGLLLISRLFISGMKNILQDQPLELSTKEVFILPDKKDITLKNSMKTMKSTYKTYKRYSSQIKRYL